MRSERLNDLNILNGLNGSVATRMRLTKNIKKAIVKQFKLGDSIEYLASIYSASRPQVENVIRFEMVRVCEQGIAGASPAAPDGRAEG